MLSVFLRSGRVTKAFVLLCHARIGVIRSGPHDKMAGIVLPGRIIGQQIFIIAGIQPHGNDRVSDRDPFSVLNELGNERINEIRLEKPALLRNGDAERVILNAACGNVPDLSGG